MHRFEETAQLPEVSNLVSPAGTDAHIRLGNDWQAHFPHKGLHGIVALSALNLPGRGDPSLGKVFLHGRLLLHGLHLVGLQSGRHMEVGPQPCVLPQPILIVRLYPVYPAVLEGKESHGAIHLIVVLQIAHPVILRERTLQFGRQLIIRCIGNAQHAHAVALQALAKLPVGMGEVG